jgi:hypothetical protein
VTCTSPGASSYLRPSNILFPFGSPNTTGVGALCYVSLHMIAPHVTMGRMQMNMFADIENADHGRGLGYEPGY